MTELVSDFSMDQARFHGRDNVGRETILSRFSSKRERERKDFYSSLQTSSVKFLVWGFTILNVERIEKVSFREKKVREEEKKGGR